MLLFRPLALLAVGALGCNRLNCLNGPNGLKFTVIPIKGTVVNSGGDILENIVSLCYG